MLAYMLTHQIEKIKYKIIYDDQQQLIGENFSTLLYPVPEEKRPGSINENTIKN
jgi:hypothetical protein